MKKKLLQKGIDPVTHQPRADLNLLANLPHLLAAANICNLMNPWDNALRIQAEAAQLAKLQLLNNLLHVMSNNGGQVPNMELLNNPLTGSFANRDYLLNQLEQPSSQLDGLVGNLATVTPSQAPIFNLSQQRMTQDDYQAISDSCLGFEGELNSKVMNNNHLVAAGSSSFGMSPESGSSDFIPALVSASSPDSSTANKQQTENQMFMNIQTSTTCDEAGEDLGLGDETNNDYCWTDFVK